MDQLTFKDLVKLFDELKAKYPVEDIMEMPVYLGDDDELNGIHCAYYCEELSNDEDDESSQCAIEMINDRAGNTPFKDKAILIS